LTERARLLDEIGAIEIRLLASGLPAETSSLLDYDLTLQQIRVFAFVFAQGQTPISGVSEALGIRPNVATGIVQRLVDRGLIERREDPGDRRVRLLTVSEQGVALINELGSILFAKERELFDRLNDQQLRQLRDILVAMETPRPAEVPGQI
jgi:DNA-binding MarR family transcriptional regulator